MNTAKPHWPDYCNHTRKNDRFLGTVYANDGTYDVFVYQNNSLDAATPDMHMCWRYGKHGSHYISPGRATPEWIARIRETRDLPEPYVKALALTEQWLRQL